MNVTRRNQRRAEVDDAFHSLKKPEAVLREIVDTTPSLTWCTLRDGSHDFHNKRWCEFTGLSVEQSCDWRWKAAMHPEDATKWTVKRIVRQLNY